MIQLDKQEIFTKVLGNELLEFPICTNEKGSCEHLLKELERCGILKKWENTAFTNAYEVTHTFKIIYTNENTGSIVKPYKEDIYEAGQAVMKGFGERPSRIMRTQKEVSKHFGRM